MVMFTNYTIFRENQLMGDSNFVRFCARVHNIQNIPKNVSNNNFLGLCISGQGISQLLDLVKKYPPLVDKILILIGTNDIIKDVSLEEYSNKLLNLIQILTGNDITICTIPPIPRFENNIYKKKLWKKYNCFILSLEGVRVLDLAQIFLEDHSKSKKYLYCMFYIPKKDKSYKRVDLIHFNEQGLDKMASFFKEKLSYNL